MQITVNQITSYQGSPIKAFDKFDYDFARVAESYVDHVYGNWLAGSGVADPPTIGVGLGSLIRQ